MRLEELDAELRAADRERWAMVHLAAPDVRARLLTLYALNCELARAARAASEPLLTQIRLQWWAEALARGSHEAPLLAAVAEAWGSDAVRLVPLAEGWMVEGTALEEIDATASELMWQAAALLGADAGAEAAVRAQGRGAGSIARLRTAPPDVELARAALEAFETAAAVALPGAVAPALWAGADARRVLVAGLAGQPSHGISEFARRLALVRFAMAGNWRVALPR